MYTAFIWAFSSSVFFSALAQFFIKFISSFTHCNKILAVITPCSQCSADARAAFDLAVCNSRVFKRVNISSLFCIWLNLVVGKTYPVLNSLMHGKITFDFVSGKSNKSTVPFTSTLALIFAALNRVPKFSDLLSLSSLAF